MKGYSIILAAAFVCPVAWPVAGIAQGVNTVNQQAVTAAGPVTVGLQSADAADAVKVAPRPAGRAVGETLAADAATAAPFVPEMSETAAGAGDDTEAETESETPPETTAMAAPSDAPELAPEADADADADGAMADADADGAMAEDMPEAEDPAPEAEEADAPAEAAPMVEAAEAEEPAVDPLRAAADKCLEIAGAPNAGVPVAAVDAETQKATLRAAAPFCTEAATADDVSAEVLFHAATVAQARGDAGATFDLLTRAAEMGLGAAETRLGDYFLFGVSPEGANAREAVAHYQRAEELNDAAGMTTLALMYRVAQGVPRDTTKMVELLTKAADLGYHFAQFRLAQTYYTGDGIPGRADPALGIPDMVKAVKYFTMAADAGNLAAALELSTLYADPTSGLPDNPSEQVRLTRLVAKTGHAPAVAMMGVFYETGRGVDYSPVVAAGLYAKAMESGKITFEQLRSGAPGGWDYDTAIEFQKILIARGTYPGPLDGVVGPGTAAGARALAAN